MATISPKWSNWLIGREEESEKLMFVQHTSAAKGSYKFSREKTDEKKAMAKLLHENARPTGPTVWFNKRRRSQQTPIGAPFDGSRQVNCHRLLRGLD